MFKVIIIIAALIMILTTIIVGIKCKILKTRDKKQSTREVQIVKKREELDKFGKKNYFITFELINGEWLELLVPKKMYEIAFLYVTGKLTYESLRFIKFATSRIEIFDNTYIKKYRKKLKH